MNGVRIAISIFLVALLAIVVRGLLWTGGHQAPAQAMASQIVLGIAAVTGIVGLAAIWRSQRPRSGPS